MIAPPNCLTELEAHLRGARTPVISRISRFLSCKWGPRALAWHNLAAALILLALLPAGCQTDDGAKRPISAGKALTPEMAEQYARQRGISTQQAHQELQQQVSDYDAQKALADVDQNGVVQR